MGCELLSCHLKNGPQALPFCRPFACQHFPPHFTLAAWALEVECKSAFHLQSILHELPSLLFAVII